MCVCSQASRSRATLSCDSSYFSYWQGTIQASYAVMRQLLLTHLSQRLIGELIGYSWSGVRPSSLTISNIFFSNTACPIKAKFYVEPPWVGGTKICSQHLGHMTKMAAMLIYGKHPSKIFFSRTGRPIFTKLGMLHWRLQSIIVCSNDDPGVTLTYF